MKTLEFEFEESGGNLKLEILENKELKICLQAFHPGEGWKITSLTAILDETKVEMIKKWLEGKNELDS